MFTWDLFLQVGIYHSPLPSWNCFYFIPQILVCYSSIFICLKVFIFLLIFFLKKQPSCCSVAYCFLFLIYFWFAGSSLQCMGSSFLWLVVVEHRLQAHRLQQLQHVDSGVVTRRPSCSLLCGIFLDQGLNPCPLCWQVDFYLLYHQESPTCYFISTYL